MKQKILMLLAVVLLSSASAFAQSGNSEPLKGDVNGDGMVDVADIAAIIDIMANGGGTVDGKQYWYLGVSDPSTFTTIGQIGDSNFDQWKEKSSPKNSISDDTNFDLHMWYLAVPSSWNAIPYDYTGGASTVGADWKATTTTKNIGGVEYTIWTAIGPTTDMNVCLHMENDVYTNKWYIGVTDPYTFDTIGQKGNDNLDVWFEKPVIRGSVSDEIDWDVHYWYVAVPSSWNAIIYDFTNGATFIGVVFSATTRTKIIGGVEYTIWKSIAATTDTSLCLHMENGVITNKWFKGDTDPATLDYVGQTKTAWDTWTEGTSITNTKVALVDDDLNDHTWYFAFPQSWNVTAMYDSLNTNQVPTTQYTITNNVSIGGSPFTVFKMNSAGDSISAYFR